MGTFRSFGCIVAPLCVALPLLLLTLPSVKNALVILEGGVGSRPIEGPPHPPIQKVVFIKTHATGSSTLTSILHSYCDTSGVRCFVHPSDIFPGKTIREGELRSVFQNMSSRGDYFDVFPNHAEFVPDEFDRMILHNFKVSLFRSPLSRMMSHFKHPPGTAVKGTLVKLERNKTVNNCGPVGTSMSEQVHVDSFHALDAVVLTEEFDLGLMMLRRKLRWKISDMVYIKKKDSPNYPPSIKADHRLMEQRLSSPIDQLNTAWQQMVQRCLQGDELLVYEMAKSKFQSDLANLTARERDAVQAETTHFRALLGQVSDCCKQHRDDAYCHVLKVDNVQWIQQKQRKTGTKSPREIADATCRAVALRGDDLF